ncbi:hypothetical protein [Leclercia tamurae]|uniref:Uncharacterized protein n=1 Tax=Leclercia tamurae TaxID=2926467 RepID=A0ABT2RBU4_9ENTR|nr:hypothetical protein [Leclercia tamurae]MCU6678355.1 hypothetical protein [Leclercia tamurae]
MTNIIKTDRFNLFELDDAIVIFSYKDYLQGVEFNLNKIVNHTANTWEANRDTTEKNKNTLQGKIVEELFIDLINHENKKTNSNLSFISYDKIRQDSFKKNAPFDGLLFEIDNPNIDIAIKKINDSITKNQHGNLDDAVLEFCRENKIYTVEIKSSKIPNNIYKASGKDPHKVQFQKNIIKQLKKLDLFKYPKFNRTDGGEINNVVSYLKWVTTKSVSMKGKSDSEILNSELNSTLHIYTRIFIDDTLINKEGKNVFIGYFLGYILGHEFYNDFKIIRFPSQKSQKAIYVTSPISNSKNLINLFKDTRLWGY